MAVVEAQYLSARDAAKFLAVCEKTLWSYSAPRGPIPCIKVGRSVRYDVDDLRAFMDSRKLSATA